MLKSPNVYGTRWHRKDLYFTEADIDGSTKKVITLNPMTGTKVSATNGPIMLHRLEGTDSLWGEFTLFGKFADVSEDWLPIAFCQIMYDGNSPPEGPLPHILGMGWSDGFAAPALITTATETGGIASRGGYCGYFLPLPYNMPEIAVAITDGFKGVGITGLNVTASVFYTDETNKEYTT